MNRLKPHRFPTTIERIIDAASTVFGEVGLDGATIERISQEAGTSKQLIYHYFDGKEDLYRTVISRSIHHIFQTAPTHQYTVENDPTEALKAMFLHYYDYFESHPDIARLSLDQGLHSGAYMPKEWGVGWPDEVKRIDGHLRRGKSSGALHLGLSARQVYLMMFSLIVGRFAIGSPFAVNDGPAALMGSDDWRTMICQVFLSALGPTVDRKPLPAAPVD